MTGPTTCGAKELMQSEDARVTGDQSDDSQGKINMAEFEET